MAKTTKSNETANMIEVFADFKEKNNIDFASLANYIF